VTVSDDDIREFAEAVFGPITRIATPTVPGARGTSRTNGARFEATPAWPWRRWSERTCSSTPLP